MSSIQESKKLITGIISYDEAQRCYPYCLNIDCKKPLNSGNWSKLSRISKHYQSKYRFCRKCLRSSNKSRIECRSCSEIIQCDGFNSSVCFKCRHEMEVLRQVKCHKTWKIKNNLGKKFIDKKNKTIELLRKGSEFSEFNCKRSALAHRFRLLRKQGYQIKKREIYQITSEPKK